MAPDLTIGVSIGIPEPHGGLLQRWRRTFGDPLAMRVPSHVTLVPPTPVRADELPGVLRHLEEVAAMTEPFRIRLRGTGTFRPVSPVVFVTLAEGVGPCELLQEKLRRPPLERELLFSYHPHVTVAQNLGDLELDRAFKELAEFQAVFEVGSFQVYEHGADEVWRPFREFRLSGPPSS